MPLSNPDPAKASIATGGYTGNDSANRAIAHGMAGTPSLVLLSAAVPASADLKFWAIMKGNALIYPLATGAQLAVTAPDSTNFYVGNVTNYIQSANDAGRVIKWVAFA